MASCDVNCPVCLTVARDPRQVPCGNAHVVCLSCLRSLFTHSKNADANSFPCPVCRNRINVPPRGVASFPLSSDVGLSNVSHRQETPHSRLPSASEHFRNGGSRPRNVHLWLDPSLSRSAFGAMEPGELMGIPRCQNLHHTRRPMPTDHFCRTFDERFAAHMSVPGSLHNNDNQTHPLSPSNQFRRAFGGLSGGRSNIPAAPESPSRPDSSASFRGQALSRPTLRYSGASRRPERRDPEYLDMDEVMSTITRIENEQQLAGAQHDLEQDEMLRMQIEINEKEDALECMQHM